MPVGNNSVKMAGRVLIFGGTGFIGRHFASYLLANGIADSVILADIDLDIPKCNAFFHSCNIENYKIEYLLCDVRKNILNQIGHIGEIDIICNFAAVHREPNHFPIEYFETNLLGAENVCEYAEFIKSHQIIFTSSIAVYGPSETPKNETSVPCPESPYGASKLVAEKIHESWLEKNNNNKLIVVRPGVVFGKGESGNVTRLMRSIVSGYFAYPGNSKTVKAGIYIKELCHIMEWCLNTMHKKKQLVNCCSPNSSTIEDYVNAIKTTLNKNSPTPYIPYSLLWIISYAFTPISKLTHNKFPLNSTRLKKLIRSNNITPYNLQQEGYNWAFTLQDAMNDWRQDAPSEWT